MPGMDVKAMLWNSPRPPARQPQPGEPLFEFLRGHDGFLCELRDHGPYGVERAQFFQTRSSSIVGGSRRAPWLCSGPSSSARHLNGGRAL